ncbi:hypothetical protein WMY93_021248 [Mugilogobius chulae]|uniref:Transmembrane protein 132C n=1 Tax=Mugilogobius chulae TaxID=88201 RepID=A0AAW0NMD1_9GOBI
MQRQDTEILNTAVLTGRTVAVPVKVVTVGTDGAVSDVTEAVECRSTDEQVIKVSERCDYVYVNGKESRGSRRVQLNFTYSFLSTQLQMSVWMPRLPLVIDVADPELSQIKGWRVPVSLGNRRYERVTDDQEEAGTERAAEGGCVPQYQSTSVRVLTHFVAEATAADSAGTDEDGPGQPHFLLGSIGRWKMCAPVPEHSVRVLTHFVAEATAADSAGTDEDGPGQPHFLLGSDWQVEVTQLVKDFLRVEQPSVAQLTDGQILIGMNPGTAKVKVLSPLTSLVLGERTVRVVDDKVSVTELGVQLVSGLSLSLQLSPGSNRAIVATATTQEVMTQLKQESFISAWLQLGDGSMIPLDNYNPAHFTLTATSLDQKVVSVQQNEAWKWPSVVAKGEGQGSLVRVEMSLSKQCQKGKRSTVLGTGMANIQVRLGLSEERRQPGERRNKPEPPYYGGSISDMETGLINRGTTTMRGQAPGRPNGGRLSADSGVQVPSEFSEYPDQAEQPHSHSTDDLLPSRSRGLTDLEIGMYALLGVFCLAIMVFLINCISYAYKYRSKQLSIETPEAMPHAHDWVWLGQDEGLCLQQDELGGTLEEGSQLLNGGLHRNASAGCSSGGKDHKNESMNSPTTKRKRVKFTTFSNAKASNGCPVLSPLALVQTSDIKWVCPDIELGDSKDLRDYMERLNENAIKNIA